MHWDGWTWWINTGDGEQCHQGLFIFLVSVSHNQKWDKEEIDFRLCVFFFKVSSCLSDLVLFSLLFIGVKSDVLSREYLSLSGLVAESKQSWWLLHSSRLCYSKQFPKMQKEREECDLDISNSRLEIWNGISYFTLTFCDNKLLFRVT